MAVSAAAACQQHPDREAIGICVRCRRRVCGECATKVQGINYCAACLEAVAATGVSPSASTSPGILRSSVVAAVHVGVLWLLIWGLLEVALPAARWTL